MIGGRSSGKNEFFKVLVILLISYVTSGKLLNNFGHLHLKDDEIEFVFFYCFYYFAEIPHLFTHLVHHLF